MEKINEELLRLITADYGTNVWFDQSAVVLARGLPWLTGLLLLMFLVRRGADDEWRRYLTAACLSGLLGAAIGWAALLLLPHPPPQEWQVGNVLLRRAVPSSLPAPGLVFMLSASLLLLGWRRLRRLGILLLLLSLLCALLRIYCRMQLPFFLFWSLSASLPAVWLGRRFCRPPVAGSDRDSQNAA